MELSRPLHLNLRLMFTAVLVGPSQQAGTPWFLGSPPHSHRGGGGERCQGQQDVTEPSFLAILW